MERQGAAATRLPYACVHLASTDGLAAGLGFRSATGPVHIGTWEVEALGGRCRVAYRESRKWSRRMCTDLNLARGRGFHGSAYVEGKARTRVPALRSRPWCYSLCDFAVGNRSTQ